MKFHEACLMFRSGVTLFGVLVGFLPWTRTTHKDKSHHDHAETHMSVEMRGTITDCSAPI